MVLAWASAVAAAWARAASAASRAAVSWVLSAASALRACSAWASWAWAAVRSCASFAALVASPDGAASFWLSAAISLAWASAVAASWLFSAVRLLSAASALACSAVRAAWAAASSCWADFSAVVAAAASLAERVALATWAWSLARAAVCSATRVLLSERKAWVAPRSFLSWVFSFHALASSSLSCRRSPRRVASSVSAAALGLGPMGRAGAAGSGACVRGVSAGGALVLQLAAVVVLGGTLAAAEWVSAQDRGGFYY